MSTEQDLLATAERALAEGDWPAARDAFRAALEISETAEALAGLGEALWWLGEVPASLDCSERAYAAFRRRGDAARAAETALDLTIDYRTSLGNVAGAAGWLERASRLVDDEGLESLRGWVRLHEAGIAPPVAGEAGARDALELARERGDLDLELCALSQLGTALIDQGRIGDGVRCLDEAMAGSLGGEGSELATVVFTSCNTIKSCTSCAQFERAVQWVRATDRFTRRYGCPFLYAQCRIQYGAVLVAIGDWAQAEEELGTAVRISRDALPALHAHALAGLAELRMAQGRLEEAERLVAGFEDHQAAVAVIARIHLAHGRSATAASTLRRWLAELGEDRLESVVLLELLGEAEIAEGEPEDAHERAGALARLGAALDCEIAAARGERLRGRALAAAGRPSEGRPHLDTALAMFTRLEMPLEAGRTRLHLAGALRERSPEVAADEARAALASLAALGASRDADAAAGLLRDLGVRAARPGHGDGEPLTGREREVLALLGEGLSNPEIAGRLYISRRTVETHVARVLSKLGLRSRAEAAAEAVRRLEAAGAR